PTSAATRQALLRRVAARLRRFDDPEPAELFLKLTETLRGEANLDEEICVVLAELVAAPERLPVHALQNAISLLAATTDRSTAARDACQEAYLRSRPGEGQRESYGPAALLIKPAALGLLRAGLILDETQIAQLAPPDHFGWVPPELVGALAAGGESAIAGI